jgi:hypothetical protein
MSTSIMALPLVHPSTVMIIGPSGSGKTSFLANSIMYDINSVSPPPTRIVYYYYTEQPAFVEMFNKVLEIRKIKIEFKQGMNDFALDSFNPQERNLVCFDDLFRTTKDSEEVAKLWFIGSHHKSITAIIISHNIFPKGKVSRELSLNTHYLVIFPHPADRQSFRTLAQRLEPTKWRSLVAVFEEEIASKPFSYLIIDLRPETDLRLKYRTCLGQNSGIAYYIKPSIKDSS